jgi:PAS domain S-box-containing protein
MGALIRAHDWSKTSLGLPESWPQPLRTTIGLLLNTGHPMYIWWGPELLCFYNDAYRQSIGPERHPGSLGLPARQVWDEIWDIIGPQIDQVMSGGGATWNENALVPITRNGRREDVYWTYSYTPIDDPDSAGGVGGVLVLCTETTAAVLAEHRRAEEMQRQRRLFEQAPGFIIVMSGPKHRVEFVNNTHRALFDSAGWVGKEIRDAFPSVAGQGFFTHLDRVYATGVIFSAHGAEVRFRRSADTPEETRYLTFIYAPVIGDGGEVTGVFCEGFDVTEGERAKNELEASDARLRHSEEQLRLATEAAEVGLWDLDVLSETLFWPPRVKRMFGISPDAPVSMADFYGGLHPDDLQRTSAAFAAALDPSQRAVYDVEYRTIGKEDGVVRWVAAKGRAIFDGDRCVRVIGAAIDITARKAAEAQLHELNETLERRVSEAIAERAKAEAHLRQAQKIDAIGQLTGGVAHDFNNLLMVISGGLSILDRQADPVKRQRILDGMRQATERGASLSRQLLAFSRRQPLKAEPIDLRSQIVAMRELLDRTLRGDVHVQTELAVDLWPILVDPTELELVILNLCVNARDAMPNGGTIMLRAENAAGVEKEGLSGDFVRMTVTDSGIGMPAEVLARVFEPFFTTKDVGKGSGLGLAQVYGFARQSGGSVQIESLVDVGTTVTLMLPRTEIAPPISLEAEADSESVFHKHPVSGSVLLVEDDDEVAALVTEMLRQLGCKVTRAATAHAALGALADGRIVDLVFSDIMMPGGMSGIALAQEIRRRRPDLPVLLTSGYVDAAAQDAAAEEITVLRKPYGLNDLYNAVRRAMLDSAVPLRVQSI